MPEGTHCLHFFPVDHRDGWTEWLAEHHLGYCKVSGMQGRLVSVLLKLCSSPLFHHVCPGNAWRGHPESDMGRGLGGRLSCRTTRQGHRNCVRSTFMLFLSQSVEWAGGGLMTRVFHRPMKYSVCMVRGDWSGSGSSCCLTYESSKCVSCSPHNAPFFVPPQDDHPS